MSAPSKSGARRRAKVGVSFKDILALSRQERPLILLAFVLSSGNEASGLVTPLVLARAFEALALAYGQPDQFGEQTREVISQAFATVMAIHVSSAIAGYLGQVTMGVASERVVARLRGRLFARLLSFEMAFFDTNKSGDLVSRLGSDTVLVQHAATDSLNNATVGMIKVLTAVVLMFTTSWQLTLIVFGTIVLFIPLAMRPIMRRVTHLSKRYQEALGLASAASAEAIGAMRTVRSFAAEDVELKRYVKHIGDSDTYWPRAEQTTFYYGVRRTLFSALLMNSGRMFVFGALQAAVWVGFVLITYGQLSFGMLTAFQAYQMQIVMGTAQLTMSFTQLAQSIGGAARLFELLRRTPQIDNHVGEVPQDPVRGAVRFEDVSFSYPTRQDVRVLDQFSLHVAAESTVALVGSSGCGKSTTIGLLLRFYDVDAGRVTLDGADVRSLDPSWLRGRMALVQQEPVLFGMSVADNVRYGLSVREDGSHADRSVAAMQAQVEAACKLANAHGFIEEFDKGYETLVGERGVRLSGGQKQRISIARALLTEPRVLLLDEATSALDSESERLVQDAIERASSGRTVLVIAHRLSTVRDADQIALIAQGAVANVGTHEQLLEGCDAYVTLVKRQLGGDDHTDNGTQSRSSPLSHPFSWLNTAPQLPLPSSHLCASSGSGSSGLTATTPTHTSSTSSPSMPPPHPKTKSKAPHVV